MNKSKIIILLVLFIAIIGFTISTVSSVDAAKYKCTVKFKKEPGYSPNHGPTYSRDGYRKEWRSGSKRNFGGSAEIYLTKKGNKVTKRSTLRLSNNYPGVYDSFKAKVTFRKWNGYKYTNKYITKTYTKKASLAYAGPKYSHIYTKNWIPISAKIYA